MNISEQAKKYAEDNAASVFSKVLEDAYAAGFRDGFNMPREDEPADMNAGAIKAVDLGLPSGMKWGSCNLGAEHPWEPGLYFAWGDTKGYKRTSAHSFDQSNAPFWNGEKYTKYADDDKLTLDDADDAAVVQLGGDWRMPVKSDFEELQDYCYWEEVDTFQNKRVAGYIIYKRHEDDYETKESEETASETPYTMENDSYIFLPRCGVKNGANVKEQSYYWARTRYNIYGDSFPSNSRIQSYDYRYFGLPIRPVLEP